MRKWIPLLIVVAAFAASAIVYPRLPEMIPTHWRGMDAQPDDWSSRAFGAWLTPVLLLGMWALVRILPAIDPRGANYAKFGGAFEAIIGSLMLLLITIAALLWVQWVHVVLITVVLLATAAVMIYSYLEWKREQAPARTTS